MKKGKTGERKQRKMILIEKIGWGFVITSAALLILRILGLIGE